MSAELPVLIVDAANVVGSRPDGWWRDRHGATVRLRDWLARFAEAYDVVLVVEGQAGGVPGSDEVAVTAAPRAGDDEIVRVVADRVAAGRRVVVVTADRGLRDRVTAAGASEIVGPGWLGYPGSRPS